MKKIRIISGTYGHRPFGKKGVHPVKVDETCDVSDEEAVRLESLKIAEIVTEVEEYDNGGSKPPENSGENKDENNNLSENENAGNGKNNENGEFAPDAKSLIEQLQEHTIDELKEIAKSKGIDCSKFRRKDEYIKALEAVLSDKEQPPVLNAENPVI
ncbi:MAG: hypothetical protein IKL10_04745 [Clostridia bacterium]|nr:hypothetical protein [Clostridia bacterium]